MCWHPTRPGTHRADDEEEVQQLSGPRFQCCKGEGLRATSRLGDYTAIAKYRQKWGGSGWFGVRAFTLENIVAAPAPAALGPSPAAARGPKDTTGLRSAGRMGAPFAPAKWNRARLSKVRVM